MRTWSLVAVIAACAACSGDIAGFGEGDVHFLALAAGVTAGVTSRIVEYSAPPLHERRSMDLQRGDTSDVPLRTDPVRGGFYAYRAIQGEGWQLVRFDAAWHVASAIPGPSVVGSDSLFIQAPILTPDGRYLVAYLAAVSGAPAAGAEIQVIDAQTLAPVRRIAGNRELFVGPGPMGTTGSEILALSGSCPTRGVVWMDAATGTVTDSGSYDCARFFRGARAHGELYLTDPQAPSPGLVRVSATTGATLAQVVGDTMPLSDIAPDPVHGNLVGYGGPYLAFFDPRTLGLWRMVRLPVAGSLYTITRVTTDLATGVLVAATMRGLPSEKGLGGVLGATLVNATDGQSVMMEAPGGSIYVLP